MQNTLTAVALQGLGDLITTVRGLVADLIPLMFGLALVYFFWGVGQFILKSGEEAKREEGKQKMLWGVIALFVMFSIFGIFQWIGHLTGIETQTSVPSDIPNMNPFSAPSNVGNG
jgi:hypothetical protein